MAQLDVLLMAGWRRLAASLALFGLLALAGLGVATAAEAAARPAAGQAAVEAGAAAGEGAGDYYQDSEKRGYWWYKDPKKEKKPEAKQPEAVEPVEAGKKPRRIPEMKDYTEEQLWNLHPDDFQELLMDFQKKAVMKPSPEAVKDYLHMQDIAQKKSLAYANVAGYVQQTTPSLNNDREFPSSQPGQSAMLKMQSESVKQKLQQYRDVFALLYFYSDFCAYCKAEQPLIEHFAAESGWEVQPVNKEREPALFERFGVTITPTIIMLKKGEQQPVPIAYGAITYPELEIKLYRTTRLLMGEITPEEYSMFDFEKGTGRDPVPGADPNGWR